MQKDSKLPGADLLASVILMVLGAWVFYEAKAMKVFRTLIISPGLFPLILGAIFALCGLVLFIMAVKRGGPRDLVRILSPASFAGVFRSPTFRRGSIILILMIIYVALFGNSYLAEKLNTFVEVGNRVVPINISFMLITAVYLFVTFLYLKAMSVTGSLAVSICAAVLVYFAFNQGFGIPIP